MYFLMYKINLVLHMRLSWIVFQILVTYLNVVGLLSIRVYLRI